MGLIRSKNTDLTVFDDDALTDYLWPIVREMIKTAIENRQDLIVEGCYIPFDWREDLDESYLPFIRFVCLAMTDEYIDLHFDEIISHESDIEKRLKDDDLNVQWLKEENRKYIDGFEKTKERVVLIESDYLKTMDTLIENFDDGSLL